VDGFEGEGSGAVRFEDTVLFAEAIAEINGDVEKGTREYLRIPEAERPNACMSCTERSCERSCPYGVRAHAMLVRAHRAFHAARGTAGGGHANA